MTISIANVSVTTSDGTNKSLGDYAGKVLLIVNVASRCGYTKQYAGLQALNEAYAAQGLTVLGFPCNDFGAQEPGTLDEIKSFCSTTYGADFELFDKVHAKGSTTEPFTTLTHSLNHSRLESGSCVVTRRTRPSLRTECDTLCRKRGVVIDEFPYCNLVCGDGVHWVLWNVVEIVGIRE